MPLPNTPELQALESRGVSQLKQYFFNECLYIYDERDSTNLLWSKEKQLCLISVTIQIFFFFLIERGEPLQHVGRWVRSKIESFKNSFTVNRRTETECVYSTGRIGTQKSLGQGSKKLLEKERGTSS